MRRSRPTLVESGLAPGILVAALALRAIRLGDANLWWDEALAVWAARKSAVGVTLWTAGDVHPPLFFWLMWAWSRLVGEGEFVLRWASALAGVALVAVSYALGRRLGGRAAGLAAAALVASSRFLVWWSMELRMYTLAALFGAGALYAALRWTTRPRRRYLAAYVLLAAAATHTVYLAAVLVAAVALGVARDSVGGRRLGPWLLAQGALAGLHVPWLLVAVPRMSSWSSLGQAASPSFVARLWLTLLATGRSTELPAAAVPTGVFWAAAGLALLGTLAARGWRRRMPPGAWPLAALVVLPPAAVWAATQPRSLFYTPQVEARYFVPFAAPVLVAVAVALVAVWRRRPVAGLVLAAAVAWPVAASLPGHYQGRRWTDALATMAQGIWTQAEAGDVVVLVSGNRYPLFLYAYDRRPDPGDATGLSGAPPDRPPVVPLPDWGGGPMGDQPWEARLEAAAGGRRRVWLVEVQSHLQDPDGVVEAWLAERWPRVLSEGYGTDALHLFDPAGAAPVVRRLAGPVHSGAAGQWAWSAPARRALPGDEVNVVLFGAPPPPVALVPRVGDGTATRPVLEVTPVAAGYTAGTEEGGAPGAGAGEGAVGTAATTVPRRHRAALAMTGSVPGGRYDVTLAGTGLRLTTLDVLRGLPLARRRAVGASIGPVTLVEVGWRPRRPRPGEAVAVDAVWMAPAAGEIAPDAVVFVHLLGPPKADGSVVWAGSDAPPSGGGWASAAAGLFDRHLLRLDPGAPPGSYSLEVGVYDPATGERWPVAGPGADVSARRLVVEGIEVVP